MSEPSTKSPSLPPRWFIRSFWAGQRAVYSVTRGRLGLRTATPDHQGMMRLRTVGCRTGEERKAILAYFEDGPDLVTMAMNGWADPEPAWWLNLLAHPDATVDLADGSRLVRGRAVNRPDFGGDSILWRKMESWQSAAAVPTPPNGGIRRS